MAKTLTSMNSVLTMAHSSLFPVATQIQGFSTDAAMVADELETGVVQMGVDGKMSYARVPNPITFTITLQSDSDSNDSFDIVEGYEKTNREKTELTFTLTIPAIKRAYTFTKCVITNLNPLAPVQRVLGPRTFKVACERFDYTVLSA